MLTTLKNAFKIKEIRVKLLYTLMMLVIIRLGCELPVPGVNREYFAQWYASQLGDSGIINAFTGGSFMNMSVFALNITPYITSSIIMQLLTIAIPKLEEMQKDGEVKETTEIEIVKIKESTKLFNRVLKEAEANTTFKRCKL